MTNELGIVVAEEVKQGVEALTTYAGSVEIKTDEDASLAGDKLAEIAALKKKVEDQRGEITKPLNQSLKSINAFFKKFTQPLESIDEQLRGKVVEFSPKSTATTFGAIHLRTNQVVTVTDEAAVPREYLQVNMAKVKAAVKAGTAIPGITVDQEKSVSL